MSPQRIQLRRTKGWRKPVGTVVVSRPSKWGNPFRVVQEPGNGTCLRGILEERGEWTNIGGLANIYAKSLYRRALVEGRLAYSVDDVVRELRGRDLACWCAVGQERQPWWHETPCHGDVLLDIANGGAYSEEVIRDG